METCRISAGEGGAKNKSAGRVAGATLVRCRLPLLRGDQFLQDGDGGVVRELVAERQRAHGRPVAVRVEQVVDRVRLLAVVVHRDAVAVDERVDRRAALQVRRGGGNVAAGAAGRNAETAALDG